MTRYLIAAAAAVLLGARADAQVIYGSGSGYYPGTGVVISGGSTFPGALSVSPSTGLGYSPLGYSNIYSGYSMPGYSSGYSSFYTPGYTSSYFTPGGYSSWGSGYSPGYGYTNYGYSSYGYYGGRSGMYYGGRRWR